MSRDLRGARLRGALYKWTDANGRVVYSDQPPTGNVKVEAINAPPPPANPNAVKELAAKEVDIAAEASCFAPRTTPRPRRRASRPTTKREQCAKVARADDADADRPESCSIATNEKGEKVYMDDAARRGEVQKLETWLRQNCTILTPRTATAPRPALRREPRRVTSCRDWPG